MEEPALHQGFVIALQGFRAAAAKVGYVRTRVKTGGNVSKKTHASAKQAFMDLVVNSVNVLCHALTEETVVE